MFSRWISSLSSEVYKAAKTSFLKSETARAQFYILTIHGSQQAIPTYAPNKCHWYNLVVWQSNSPRKTCSTSNIYYYSLGVCSDAGLPDFRKSWKIGHACENLLATSSPCSKIVAQVFGPMTASVPGGMYSPLHHKFLERTKHMLWNCTKGILIRTWADTKKPP